MAVAVTGCLLVVGACTTSETTTVAPSRAALLGKSEQELVACAGQPQRRIQEDAAVVMVSVNEADALERSFAGSKGSLTGLHHGCKARVTLREGKVADAQFNPFPTGSGASDHGERIFADCVP